MIVFHRISPYTVVYDRVCSTWVDVADEFEGQFVEQPVAAANEAKPVGTN
jgi:hypothetical protein